MFQLQRLSSENQASLKAACDKIINYAQTQSDSYVPSEEMSDWQKACLSIYVPPEAINLRDSTQHGILSMLLEEAFQPTNNNRIVCLVGDPGGGKTTFLRHLLRERLEAYRTTQARWLPIFISLNKIQEQELRIEYLLQDYFRKNLLLDANQLILIKTQPLFVLCDGYDEIGYGGNLYQDNHWEEWSNVCFIVTTRPEKFGEQLQSSNLLNALERAFKPALPEYQLALFQLQEFYPPQVEAFTRQWLAISGMQQGMNVQQLLGAMQQLPGLSELNRNPVILSLLLYALPDILRQNLGDTVTVQL